MGFCLYIAIPFHSNLTEAKLMSVQSLNILHLNYSTKSSLISWPACLVKPWMLNTFHVGFRFCSITQNETLLSSMLKVSSKEF